VVAKDAARKAELNQQVYEMAEAVRIASLLLAPVMPASCTEILARLGETRTLGELRLDRDAVWSTSGERFIVRKDPMWPRIETGRPDQAFASEQASSMTEAVVGVRPAPRARQDVTGEKQEPAVMSDEHGARAPSGAAAEGQGAVPPATPRLSFDQFMKIELRVAKVVASEPVPKSKKLLKLEIDLGTERRTVVAGIAGAYAPETLVGRSVIVVANLEPATLMGVESNGMVLAASAADGRPILLTVDDVNAAPPGTKVT
jgi:methionyl-tRNA synthetase